MIIEPLHHCRHRDIRPPERERLQIASRAQKSHSTVAAGRGTHFAHAPDCLGFPFELFSVAPDDDAAAASEVRRPTAFHVKIELSRPALNRHSDPIRTAAACLSLALKGKIVRNLQRGLGKLGRVSRRGQRSLPPPVKVLRRLGRPVCRGASRLICSVCTGLLFFENCFKVAKFCKIYFFLL